MAHFDQDRCHCEEPKPRAEALSRSPERSEGAAKGQRGGRRRSNLSQARLRLLRSLRSLAMTEYDIAVLPPVSRLASPLLHLAGQLPRLGRLLVALLLPVSGDLRWRARLNPSCTPKTLSTHPRSCTPPIITGPSLKLPRIFLRNPRSKVDI